MVLVRLPSARHSFNSNSATERMPPWLRPFLFGGAA